MDFLAKHDIYSIVLLSAESDAFSEDSKATDIVPFFCSSNVVQAEELIGNLMRNPMEVVMKAINGEDVAISFSHGFPS